MTIAFLSHLDLNLYLFRLPVMRRLVQLGHTVYAVCPEGEYFNRFEKLGIRAVSYPIERDSLNPLRELGTILKIRAILKELDPDIVHSFMHKPNIYGAFGAPKHCIQTVTGAGSFFLDETLHSRLVRSVISGLYRFSGRFVDRVIFQNADDLKLFTGKRIVDPDRARLVRSSGIDVRRFVPSDRPEHLLKESGIDETKPVVLMIARVLRDKGVLEYIEAAERLKERANFLYVGDYDRGNKSSLRPEWGAVRALGFRENVAEWIALSDLVVLPSYREGVPRTLLEAAAMGKAIVTTDVPGCREVVRQGENGLLVPARDAEALSEAVASLLDDPEARRRMGKRSREIAVEEFAVDHVVEQYLKIYAEVLQ